jgi:hypothetical protein
MPADSTARPIARLMPAPSGSGAVMWCASALIAYPSISARIGAPRARARSRDSSTTMPAPSPTRMPRRPRSNGWHRSGATEPSRAKPVKATRENGSVPPATITSARPNRMVSNAQPML